MKRYRYTREYHYRRKSELEREAKKRQRELSVDDWLLFVVVQNPDPADHRDQLTSEQLWALERACPPLVEKWWKTSLYPRINQHFIRQFSDIQSQLFQVKDLCQIIVDYWQGFRNELGFTNLNEPSTFWFPCYWHFGDVYPLSSEMVQLLREKPEMWTMKPETIPIWPDRFYKDVKLIEDKCRLEPLDRDEDLDDNGMMFWRIGEGEISFHPDTNARPHPHIISLELAIS